MFFENSAFSDLSRVLGPKQKSFFLMEGLILAQD